MEKKAKTKVDELRDTLQKRKDAPGPQKKNEGETAAEFDIQTELSQAEEEAKKHYDKLLHVLAEFENFKKRMGREKEELVKYGNEKLLLDLLPALDDLDRVLDHVPPDASDDVKKFAEGVELVRKSLISRLEKYNLKPIDAMGAKFNPSVHEAIATVESESAEPGTVIAVNRNGYMLCDRLLRPAMVTVSKGE
jgi:molecular chaperone GrpE